MEAAYSDGFDTEDDQYIIIESSLDEDTIPAGTASLGDWAGGSDDENEW